MAIKLTYARYVQFNYLRKTTVAAFVVLSGAGIGMSVQNDSADSSFGWALIVAFAVFAVGAVLAWDFRRILADRAWDYAAKNMGGKIIGPDDVIGGNSPIAGPVITDCLVDYSVTRAMTMPQYGAVLRQISATYTISKYFTGESGRFKLDYLVLAVPLDVSVPHIFIDATKQNRFSVKNDDLWSLNKKVKASNRIIDLEGDFYQSFKVYTANKQGLDALTILTPDVMLKLRDEGHNLDYELYGNNLYVIGDTTVLRNADISAFINAAESCIKELLPQITDHTFSTVDATMPLNINRVRRLAIWFGSLLIARKFVAVVLYYMIGIMLGQLLTELGI